MRSPLKSCNFYEKTRKTYTSKIFYQVITLQANLSVQFGKTQEQYVNSFSKKTVPH